MGRKSHTWAPLSHLPLLDIGWFISFYHQRRGRILSVVKTTCQLQGKVYIMMPLTLGSVCKLAIELVLWANYTLLVSNNG
jgi:hypothetical protein